jgi:hypothetical protein
LKAIVDEEVDLGHVFLLCALQMQRQSKAQPRGQLTALPQENLPSQWGEDIAHPSVLPSQKDGCESEGIAAGRDLSRVAQWRLVV